MSLKTKQNLSINNKLAMTQQIQLAIKLLQLNSIDLQKEIEDKIMENPFLENENSSDHVEISSESPVSSSNFSTPNSDTQDAYEQLPSSHQSLHEYLMWQINLSSMSQQDQFIAYNIIDYINHPQRIFPIGRLDKTSEGLIFLTNDGDIVNKILRAKNKHEKEKPKRKVTRKAKKATTKYILYTHDDMYFCPGWDNVLKNELDKLDNNLFYLSASMIEKNSGHIKFDCGNDFSDFVERGEYFNFYTEKYLNASH